MQHEPAKINSLNIYQINKEKILLKIIRRYLFYPLS